jgi:hypothetical protein
MDHGYGLVRVDAAWQVYTVEKGGQVYKNPCLVSFRGKMAGKDRKLRIIAFGCRKGSTGAE